MSQEELGNPHTKPNPSLPFILLLSNLHFLLVPSFVFVVLVIRRFRERRVLGSRYVCLGVSSLVGYVDLCHDIDEKDNKREGVQRTLTSG